LRPLSAGLLRLLLLSTLGPLMACSQTENKPVVTIFHAASMSRSLATVAERLSARQPGLDLRLEPSGSTVAARKVAELGRRADLVISADRRIIDRLLLPDHASWSLPLLSNEIVLAHLAHSRHTDEIDAKNWTELLLDPQLRLGRANEHTAPLGIHTLLVWKLAERAAGADGAGLAAKLTARCRPEHVVPDVGELVSLLQARAIDYAFVFRSIAEEHNLKLVRLAPEINLGSTAQAESYAGVQIQVRLLKDGNKTTLAGAPIQYGLTIPNKAPNPQGAQQVVAFLFSPEGRAILQGSGFIPLPPVTGEAARKLPARLRQMLDRGQVSR
jgi:molybdate/tungstate transport system substrate-binding protein